MRLRNELAGRIVLLAAPYVWRQYRTRIYVVAALVAAPLLWRQAQRRILARRSDRDAVRDRMIDPLPDEQRASPTPTPEAFVDSALRDTTG